jgi:hypothetical protein
MFHSQSIAEPCNFDTVPVPARVQAPYIIFRDFKIKIPLTYSRFLLKPYGNRFCKLIIVYLILLL